MRKYRFHTREAAERAVQIAEELESHARQAIRCLLEEGVWDKPVLLRNRHYLVRVCQPTAANGGTVLLRETGIEGACSDVWSLDDFLAHAGRITTLDDSAFALREIAQLVREVRDRALEKERTARERSA
jgi:hypothetical protein